MVEIEQSLVEEKIIQAVEELSIKLKIEADIDKECCPGLIGISSQVLITIMGRLEDELEIIIPDSCYIFHDKETKKQLSVKEAAEKLIKIAEYGK